MPIEDIPIGLTEPEADQPAPGESMAEFNAKLKATADATNAQQSEQLKAQAKREASQRAAEQARKDQDVSEGDWTGDQTRDSIKVNSEEDVPLPTVPDDAPLDIPDPTQPIDPRQTEPDGSRRVQQETRMNRMAVELGEAVDNQDDLIGQDFSNDQWQYETHDRNLDGGGGDGKYMFKIEHDSGVGAGDQFTVRPGVWKRNGNWNASSHSYDLSFDFGQGSNATIWVYCCLKASSGDPGANAPPNDWSNESVYYDHNNDGSNGLFIMATDGPLAADMENDYFHHFLLLGQVTTDALGGMEISQAWMGEYEDNQWGWDNTMQPFTPSQELTPTVNLTGIPTAIAQDFACTGGYLSIRGDTDTKDILVLGLLAVPGGNSAWWAEWTASTSPAKDPSLVPSATPGDATVKTGPAFPADLGYEYRYKKLFSTSNSSLTARGFVFNYMFIYGWNHVGHDIVHDWNRPDGTDSGIPNNDVNPRGRTIGFIPPAGAGNNGIHEGELEAYHFTNDVINGQNGNKQYGGPSYQDQILTWWGFVVAGETIRKYARLDAVGFDAHASGKSLWIRGGVPTTNPDFMELYNFWQTAASGDTASAAIEDFDTGTDLDVLVRDRSGGQNKPELKYRHITTSTSPPSGTCTYLYENCCTEILDCITDDLETGIPSVIIEAINCEDFLEHCLIETSPGVPGYWEQNLTHYHENHTFNSDDHDGSAGPGTGTGMGSIIPRYIEVTSGAGRNNMDGKIGDGAGNDSIAPDNRELYNSLFAIGHDYGVGQLNDENAVKSIQYADRDMWNFSGVKTVDWQNGLLYTAAGYTVDWGSSNLTIAGVSSVDWLNKSLKGAWDVTGLFTALAGLDVTGSVDATVSYEVAGTKVVGAQQTGMGAQLSPAIAGATYGATEQTMLQNVYNKMVNMEARLTIHGLIAT